MCIICENRKMRDMIKVTTVFFEIIQSLSVESSFVVDTSSNSFELSISECGIPADAKS